MKIMWWTWVLVLVLCMGCCAAADVKEIPASMPIPEILPSDLSKAGWDVEALLKDIPMKMEADYVNGWPMYKDLGFDKVSLTTLNNGVYEASFDFVLVDGYWQLLFCNTAIESWVDFGDEQLLYIDLPSRAHLGYYNGAFMQWQTKDYSVWLSGGAYPPKDAAIWDKWVFHVSSTREGFSYSARYNKSGSMMDYTCNARARYDVNNRLIDFVYYVNGIEYLWSMEREWINAETKQAVDCPIDDFSVDFVYECYPPQVKKVEVPGDSDDNGKVDLADIIALIRHLAGGGASVSKVNSNVTGDDNVDAQDVLCIMQYIAGWDVGLK